MTKAKFFLVYAFWLLTFAGSHKVTAEELVTVDFIRFAFTKNLSEVAAAKLALKTSNSPAVQAYARYRLDEQAALLDSLESLAQQEGVMLERPPQAAYVFIRKGETFDTAYASKRTAELKRMVRVVRKAMLTENPHLRRYAEQTLPLLMHHWYKAQQLVRALNNPAHTDSLLATR
ncbi:MAG TPA: DUF4142 domain-containing protein [Cellvibrio sp.]